MRHYYHAYVGGSAWVPIVTEHAKALRECGWDSPVTIGLVGPPATRDAARALLGDLIPGIAGWVEATEGYEQVTLQALLDDARQVPEETAFLYAHAKGTLNPGPWSDLWRRSMTARVVADWRRCVPMLEAGFDTVGCHWLQDHHLPDHRFSTPFYGGNFWLAASSYLRKLPDVPLEARHDAESWIGLGSPRAADLLPGWPSRELCQRGDRTGQ